MMLASKGSTVALYSLLVLALIYLFWQTLLNMSSKYSGQSFCQLVHHDDSIDVLERSSSEVLLPNLLPDREQPDIASSIDFAVRKEDSSSLTNLSPPESTNIYESLRKYAVNNTVMIVPVNKGMLQYAENMLCSLQKTNFDLQNMVFWTLDNEVGEILQTRGFNTFYDPSIFGVADFVGINGREHFEHMMIERPKFFINVLSIGLDFLFLDTEIVFFDDPMTIIDPFVDLVIGSDGRAFFGPAHNPFKDPYSKGNAMPPVCAGSFWIKSNEDTVAMWEVMKLVFQGDLSVRYLRDAGISNDQYGLDVLLNEGRAKLVEPFPEGITADMLNGTDFSDARLRVRMMNQALFASGHQFMEIHEDYEQALAILEAKGRKKLAIHFNWNGGTTTKIDGAKRMGLWYLDDDQECK